MTITELLQHLTDIIDSGDVKPDAEVRLLVQPNYPLQTSVGGLATLEAFTDRTDGAVVYITEGESLGYGPRHVDPLT